MRGDLRSSTSNWENSLSLPVSPERDHIYGPATARVTLLEYGDYQCPYCGAAHEVIGAIQARMGPALRFVFRHFPLTTIHPMAEPAAEAAEAAGAQGKFWAFHDLLYASQDQLGPPYFLQCAQLLGLDLERFDDELINHVHAAKVREDFYSGVRSNVNGTPSFFIEGRRYTGSWEAPALLAALEREAGLTPVP